MSKGDNPYSILGVSESCTNDEVKAAYHKLAKEWHPDVNPHSTSTERFRSISAAYDTLKDERTRFEYIERRRNQSIRDYYSAQSVSYGNMSKTDDMWRTSTPAEENIGFWRTMYRKPVVKYALIPAAVLITAYACYSTLSPPAGDYIALPVPSQHGRNVPTVAAWFNPKTKRWETPAPWNADYRRSIAVQPAQQVRKDHVHDSSR